MERVIFISLVQVDGLWWGFTVGPLLSIVCAAALIGAVIAAVHHAEVVAHRVGEPFGTLVLAVAVTIIEIRPCRNGWQVYECAGVQPVFMN